MPGGASIVAMEDDLLTESRNPRSESIDALGPLEIVRLMNAEDAHVVAAVGAEAEAIARAIEWAADRFRQGGRLIYVGAGTSGRLGVLDAAECPPSFGTPPELVVGLIAGGPSALTRAIEGAEDSPDRGAEDVAGLGVAALDLVVGIATSGRTPYVLGAVREARRRGGPGERQGGRPSTRLNAGHR
jgi:N-acetylmuramic acid 6-phosphate etherase